MRFAPLLALALLVSATAAAGCGSDDRGDESRARVEKKPAEGAQSPAAEGDKSEAIRDSTIALLEQIADAADENQDDCGAMARQIDTLLHRSADLLEAAKAMKKGDTQDQEMQEKYQPRMMAAMGKLMPALEKCRNNEALKKAMEKLD